jgi:hypothetical protein
MHKQASALIVQTSSQQWFYGVESHPSQDRWDWLDHAKVYGPFTDEAGARSHLVTTHGGNVGLPITRHWDAVVARDAQLQALPHRAVPA